MNYNNKELDDLNHPELVTLACLSLGGLKKKIHTEEIGIKAHKFSQTNFSWRLEKHKNIPDMAKIRKAIDRARKELWLIGSYSYNVLQDGWKVTQEGNLAVEKYLTLANVKKTNFTLTPNDKKLINRLTKSDLFKNYLKDEINFNINIYDLADLLNSSSDANHIRDKFYSLSTIIELSNSFELKKLFREIEVKFSNILNKGEYKKNNMVMSKKEKIDL